MKREGEDSLSSLAMGMEQVVQGLAGNVPGFALSQGTRHESRFPGGRDVAALNAETHQTST